MLIDSANIQFKEYSQGMDSLFPSRLDENISSEAPVRLVNQIVDELVTGNYAAYLPQTNEELLRRGVIGTYRGANIVSLKNFKDDEDVSFFPANEMFVVGRDASKFAFWGDLLSKEWTEQDNWYWHFMARKDFGGVVHRPERLRRIIDTSLSA